MNTGSSRSLPGVLLLLFLIVSGLSAQETGPDFLCTRSEAGGEILTWQNRAATCGPYLGTVIYRSDSEAGPFTPLDTIADQSATEYRDENPTGARFFYYLEYLVDCVDNVPEVSDTLDNFIPETPLLRFISVIDGDLELVWEPSPSPEVTGYVILEVTGSGNVPIDTVGQVTSYLITGVPDAELTTRQYRIAAIDPCGNDSPQSRIATAISLTGSGGVGCDSDIGLTPVVTELSDFSLDPFAQPDLFISIDGGGFQRTAYVPDTSLSRGLIYQDGRDGQNVCFYVQLGSTSGDSVRTDTLCRTLSITPRLPPVDLYGYEFDDAGQMIVKYSVGEAIGPLITEASLLYDAGNQPQLLLPISPIELTRDSLIVSELIPPDPVGAIVLEFFDGCDRQSFTNPAGNTFLSAETVGGQAELNWVSAFNGNLGEQRTYTILRQTANGDFEVLEENWPTTDYIDATTGSGCYRVITNFTPPDRDTVITFRSNIACVVADAEVYVPNIFSPNASQPENRTLRPLFSGNAIPPDYSFRVFDRWGGLYFESDNPSDGWLGGRNGKFAPTGNYVYTLSYSTGGGNLQQLTGVVILIR